MGHTAEDRRKFERFQISAPAMMEIEEQESAVAIETRDISAGGAFFLSAEPLTAGEKVKIEIVIPNETITNLAGTQFQLKVEGTVIRCESNGIAVKFNGQEIMPVGSLMDN